jgi:hypothetical protein
MTEEQPKSDQGQAYEAPQAEDLDTEHCPAVTCAAATQQSPLEDTG